jgi:spore maturation protein CgeB
MNHPNNYGFIQGLKSHQVNVTVFDIDTVLNKFASLPGIAKIISKIISEIFEVRIRHVDPDGVIIIKGDRRLNKTFGNIASSNDVPTLWFTPDDPAQFMHLSHQTAPHVDYICTSAAICVEAYQEMGYDSAYYFPLPVHPEIPQDKPNLVPPSILYLGRWYPERERYLKPIIEMDSDVMIVGPEWGKSQKPVRDAWIGKAVYGDQARQLRYHADIVLNVPHVIDMLSKPNWATFETLASNGFLITKYAEGMNKLFTNEEHLVWVGSPKEMAEKVKYFLNNPVERSRIANSGHKLVSENYSYSQWAKKALTVLFNNRFDGE